MPTPNSPPAPQSPAPRAPVRWVLALSTQVLRMERHLLTALMTLLVLLILLNVVTRYTGMPIYWVDEAAHGLCRDHADRPPRRAGCPGVQGGSHLRRAAVWPGHAGDVLDVDGPHRHCALRL